MYDDNWHWEFHVLKAELKILKKRLSRHNSIPDVRKQIAKAGESVEEFGTLLRDSNSTSRAFRLALASFKVSSVRAYSAIILWQMNHPGKSN